MTPQRRRFVMFGLLALSAAGVAYDRLHARTMGVSDAVVRRPAAAMSAHAEAPTGEVIAGLHSRSDFASAAGDAFPAIRPAATVAPPVLAPAPIVARAPALPFTVIGKKLERGVWEVYLAKGDATFIAKQGAVVADDYKISAIAPTSMTLIYLPLGEQQTLPLGASLQ